VNVNVTVDAGPLLEQLKQLGGRQMAAAVNASTNRALAKLKTETNREIRRTYAIKAKDVNQVIEVSRSTVRGLSAVMRVKAKQIPLQDFGNAKETKRGVRVTIRRGAGRTLYPRSFQATSTKGSGKQVFWRTKAGDKLVPRGPLKLLLGPAVSQIVGSRTFLAKLQPIALETFRTTLKNQINFRSKRIK
jgi:hypothetical protein